MSTHRGVNAAEKYAELEARGEDRPKCDCCGVGMYWSKNPSATLGGYWKPRCRQAASDRRWYSKPANALRRNMRNRVYWAEGSLARMEARKEELGV